MIKEKLIGKVPIDEAFQNFPSHLESVCMYKEVPKGATLTRKGFPIEHIYAILSGSIEILSELQSGEFYAYWEYHKPNFIGDLELLTGKLEAAATVRATTPVSLVQIPTQGFIKWYESDPNLIKVISQMNAQKLYNQSSLKGEYLLLSSYHKLLLLLKSYYIRYEQLQETVTVTKSQVQLARELGVSTKTVMRKLNEVLNQGLIGWEQKKISITKNQYKMILEKLDEVL